MIPASASGCGVHCYCEKVFNNGQGFWRCCQCGLHIIAVRELPQPKMYFSTRPAGSGDTEKDSTAK